MHLMSLLLCLIAGAFAMLAAGLVLHKLGLPSLAENVNVLGAKALLTAYALLLAGGVCYALKSAAEGIADYFSVKQAARRKLLFAQNKLGDMQQLHSHEQRQLYYFNALKRADLLHANNAKHIRVLADSISLKLYNVRDNMPRTLYKDLKNALRKHVRQQDYEALLSLQKQFDIDER